MTEGGVKIGHLPREKVHNFERRYVGSGSRCPEQEWWYNWKQFSRSCAASVGPF